MNAPGSLLMQIANPVGALQYFGRTSRSEKTGCAGLNHLLKCVVEIGCFVEGAMKSDFEWPRIFNQSASPLHINATVCAQNTQRKAAGACLPGKVNLPMH